MHDPKTVAFDIPNPLAKRYKWAKRWSQRPALITIWHVDPEKHGDEDSCDWFGHSRPLNARETAITEAIWDLETVLDNKPFFPDHVAHKRFQVLKTAVREWRQRPKFRLHPRWHVWHWSIQVHPYQHFARWARSRCQGCGKGFRWGYSPVSGSRNGAGPSLMRGERNVWHMECHTVPGVVKNHAEAQER